MNYKVFRNIKNILPISLFIFLLCLEPLAWAENDAYDFIESYKPTYLLATYVTTKNNSLKGLDGELDQFEIKFQLSFKVELFKNVTRKYIYSKSKLYFAYTQLSLWQAFNNRLSSPFRETNYEPEVIFALKDLRMRFSNLTLTEIDMCFVHQSNGRSEPASRSWNRLCSTFIVRNKSQNLMIAFKPWFRIPEKKETDNNSDILKYMGYAECSLHYQYKNSHYSLMIRNNLRHKNYSALQLEWSFSLTWIRLEGVRAFIQIFNGYGDSLIDYDHSITRIGIGFNITNWL